MDATWLKLRNLRCAQDEGAKLEELESPQSKTRFFGKGPIMTFMTAIVFATAKNVKLFLRIRWNLPGGVDVVYDCGDR